MLTGDYHQTAIAVARGVGMLPADSQLVIIQARSEMQSTPQPPSRAPAAFDSGHSLRPPAHLAVTTSSGPGKPAGQGAGTAQVSGSKAAGSMGGQEPSSTEMCGNIDGHNAVSHDPVHPFTAQEQPPLHKSSQQGSCQQGSSQQRSSQEQSCQQPSAQQQSLHQQSGQVKLSENRTSVSPLNIDAAQPVCSQQGSDQVVKCLQRSSYGDLVFMLQRQDDEEEIEAQRAITSLAQVGPP